MKSFFEIFLLYFSLAAIFAAGYRGLSDSPTAAAYWKHLWIWVVLIALMFSIPCHFFHACWPIPPWVLSK